MLHVCITTRDGNIRNDVMAALMTACEKARQAGIPLSVGRQMYQYGIATCRNKAVADFLKTPADWLMFVDDDVLLPPNAVVDLCETRARQGRDVVCGPYPSLKFVGNTVAHLYVTLLGLDLKTWAQDYPQGEVEVGGGGTGCMMIGRHVLEKLGHPWFRWPEQYDRETGTVQVISDDIDFCDRVRQAGFRIWADGRVRCGHLKLVNLSTMMDGSLKWRESIPDAESAYGSHIGALKVIAGKIPVHTVAEYGCGKYSTPTFLDRSIFPDVRWVHSLESSPEWRDDTLARCNHDERLVIQLVPVEQMAAAELWKDLVFIDCDSVFNGQHDFSARCRLINEYQDSSWAGVVVVHDANFASIWPTIVASTFKYKAIYQPEIGPHTAVLSNQYDVTNWFN